LNEILTEYYNPSASVEDIHARLESLDDMLVICFELLILDIGGKVLLSEIIVVSALFERLMLLLACILGQSG